MTSIGASLEGKLWTQRGHFSVSYLEWDSRSIQEAAYDASVF